jgi:hypothetical protein
VDVATVGTVVVDAETVGIVEVDAVGAVLVEALVATGAEVTAGGEDTGAAAVVCEGLTCPAVR